jgi:hypothetical protein
MNILDNKIKETVLQDTVDLTLEKFNIYSSIMVDWLCCKYSNYATQNSNLPITDYQTPMQSASVFRNRIYDVVRKNEELIPLVPEWQKLQSKSIDNVLEQEGILLKGLYKLVFEPSIFGMFEKNVKQIKPRLYMGSYTTLKIEPILLDEKQESISKLKLDAIQIYLQLKYLISRKGKAL